ncbi:MAG: hypothetical protein K2H76_05575 [Muribaculaceae bacterium]|nr:hypothetical protein [Muribaculaceae bacterium]
MKLTKLTWAALGVAVLASCSDKKTEVDNPDGPQGNGTMEAMSPEQSKEFLQNATIDFLNNFKPEEQKDIIELAAYFDAEYADYELPDNFDIDSEPSYSPRTYLRQLAKAAKGDIDALTRAANSYNLRVNFDRFAGVYEASASKEKWVRTGNSQDILFKFTDKGGMPVELKIIQSGGTSEIDFTLTDWDYEYVNGTYEEIEEKYNYYLSVPKNLTATLTQNGKQLANTTVVSSIDVKGHTISADVDATMMNLRATAKVAGNDSKVESRTELYANNQKIATAYATVEGSGLCDIDRYKELENLEDDMLNDRLGDMFKSGDCGMDVLGKVQVYGQLTYYPKLFLDLDGSYDGWAFDKDREKARKACQAACDLLNRKVKAQLRYNYTTTDQATILFQPGFRDWDYMWEYYTQSVLLFPDDTKYSVDEYFDNFTMVSNKFDTLFDAYMKIWNQAKK